MSSTNRQTSKKVYIALGITLLVTGALAGGMWYASSQARREAAQVESLQAVGAEALGEQRVGEDVLVAGTLAKDNPARFRGFVAYLHYEPRRDRDASGGTTRTKWRVRERVTPPLWLETPGGRVRIGNSTYALGTARKEPSELAERGSTSWRDENEGRVWNRSEPSTGPQWYTGFEAGESVVVLGKLTRGGAAPEVEAVRVFGGSREEMVSSAKGAATLFGIMAWVFAPISLAALVGLVWQLSRRR